MQMFGRNHDLSSLELVDYINYTEVSHKMQCLDSCHSISPSLYLLTEQNITCKVKLHRWQVISFTTEILLGQ
jgi:hypothetical protein